MQKALFSKFGAQAEGRNVYLLSNGTATELDPDNVNRFWTRAEGSPYVTKVCWGSSASGHTVNAAQRSALETAGFTVTSWNVRLGGAASTHLSAVYLASYQVTGDLDVQIRASVDDLTPSGTKVLVAQWTSANQNWQFQILTGSTLQFLYSTTGSNSTAKTSTVSLSDAGLTDGQLIWLRVTHDVDNGAAGHDIKFWYSTTLTANPALITWSQLGSTVTTATAITRFASTSPLRIGMQDNGDLRLAANVYRARVLNGIAGTVVADMNPDDADSLTASTWQAPSTAERWTLNGTAALAEAA